MKVGLCAVIIFSAASLLCAACNKQEHTTFTLQQKEIEAPVAIEASGVTVYKDFVAVISDDNKGDVPQLHLFSFNGEFIKTAAIASFVKIEDMEGISSNGRELFITTSLNGKGSKREHFLAVDSNLNIINRVNLRHLLRNCSNSNVAALVATKDFDIEGLATVGSTHYFGVKAPVIDGKATLIIVENIFGESPIVTQRTIATDGGITAIAETDSSFFIVSKNKDTSLLWELSLLSGDLIMIGDLHEKRVEGVMVTDNGLVFVKDGNSKKSKFIFLAVSKKVKSLHKKEKYENNDM